MLGLLNHLQEDLMSSQKNMHRGEVLLYQTEHGATRIDVRLQDETVWLTQMQMAELFQKDKRIISEHILNIYEENELSQEATARNFRIDHYPKIISHIQSI
jgi:hypothetical protein